MKDLKTRQKERAKDRETAIERERFDHAEFLRSPKGGSTEGGGNHGGADQSKSKSQQGEGGSGGSSDGKDGSKAANSEDAGGSDKSSDDASSVNASRKTVTQSDPNTTGLAGATGTTGAANGGAKPKGDATKAREREAGKAQGTGWGDPGTGNNAGATGGATSRNPQM